MKLLNIRMDEIITNPNQPRKHFDKVKMEELKESIKNNGLIQPIIVRKTNNGKNREKYEIIAGERRFRACFLLGMEKIQGIVISSGNSKSYEYSVLENIQRENLNPIEEAEAYLMLTEIHGYTQEKLAKKIGKTRSSVSNKIRLLKLPEKVKEMVKEGSLSYAHARTLLSASDSGLIEKLAEKTVEEGYSVREVENFIKNSKKKKNERKDKADESRSSNKNINNINLNNSVEENFEEQSEKNFLEKKLREFFESRVEIKGNLMQGKIEINFYDYEDLERIIGLLNINFE